MQQHSTHRERTASLDAGGGGANALSWTCGAAQGGTGTAGWPDQPGLPASSVPAAALLLLRVGVITG